MKQFTPTPIRAHIFPAGYRWFFCLLETEEERTLYKRVLSAFSRNEMYVYTPVPSFDFQQVFRIIDSVLADFTILSLPAQNCITRHGDQFLEIQFVMHEYDSSAERRNQTILACQKLVDDIPITIPQIEQFKLLHDRFCRTFTYSPLSNTARDASGPALGGTGVCSGFTRCLKLCLDLLGIPAIAVHGYAGEFRSLPTDKDRHAWCLIQIGDWWFQTDITWDICRSKKGDISYDYFLLSDFEMARDHHLWSTFLGDRTYRLPPCTHSLSSAELARLTAQAKTA